MCSTPRRARLASTAARSGSGPVVRHELCRRACAGDAVLRGQEHRLAPAADARADETLVLAVLVAGGRVQVVDAPVEGLEQRGARLRIVRACRTSPPGPCSQSQAPDSCTPVLPRERVCMESLRLISACAGLVRMKLYMIIDCHGHYTTAPAELQKYRDSQIAGLKDPAHRPAPANLQDRRRSDPGEPGGGAAQVPARARHGPDDFLAACVRHGAPHRQRGHQPQLVAGLQRPDPPGLLALSRELRRRVPAAAVTRVSRPETVQPSSNAASASWASSAATSIPTLPAGIGTHRR